MDSTSSSDNSSSFIVSSQKQQQRKKAIPKVVNDFVLENYGKLYYDCGDCSGKMEILQNIESQLKTAGYYITALEVERRLKNMKSHYRSKKKDLEMGIIKTVEWEYFSVLDKIFSVAEKLDHEISPKTSSKAETSEKRKVAIEPKSEKGEVNETPEDL